MWFLTCERSAKTNDSSLATENGLLIQQIIFGRENMTRYVASILVSLILTAVSLSAQSQPASSGDGCRKSIISSSTVG